VPNADAARGRLVIGQHQDVHEHSARRGTDRFETGAELALDVPEVHSLRL
jgi:hypothetical protein